MHARLAHHYAASSKLVRASSSLQAVEAEWLGFCATSFNMARNRKTASLSSKSHPLTSPEVRSDYRFQAKAQARDATRTRSLQGDRRSHFAFVGSLREAKKGKEHQGFL